MIIDSKYFYQFQVEHYTKLLENSPKFLVNEKGDIVANPARSYRRKKLHELKKQLCD